jgi:PKD repeat protein
MDFRKENPYYNTILTHRKMTRNLLGYFSLSLIVSLLGTEILSAQQWKNPMADNTQNFYVLQAQFNHDMRWKVREIDREARSNSTQQQANKSGSSQASEESEANMEGYLQYKRWEDFMAPRVYPSGDLSLTSTNWARFEDYLNNNPAAMQQYLNGQNHSALHQSGPNSTQSSTWTFVGPTGAPTGSGAGRVTFIRVDPTNANNLWIGAPAGGLWKSTNGGSSWTTNTDFLTVIGASDVAIDPSNTQNMYLATGDGDAGDTYSIGVLKSTDGGTTWNTTGLTWSPNQGRLIRKLLINPTTPSTIMAFSNVGIWRTTNSGTSWTQVQSTNGFTDAEFQPGTPATVYACGTTFWRSTDGGATWTQVTSGLPANTSVDRLAIAVTAANTSYIYLVAGSAANDGFFGFYRSTNGGTSFTQITVSSPSNILGWASAGNDTGGQGWYDLVIDASPTNANEVCVGGVNVWRTTNGGTSWTLNAHWTGTGAPYVHADHHAMIYTNGTTMYEGCDGGIFKTTNNGSTWIDISANLCIAQIYRIGLSASNASLWITGHQDNGTNLKNGAAYTGTMGGDGMDCFIDRTNNNVMYGEQYQGSLNRSTNGGGSWTGITTGLTGTAPWVTPWYQDPTTANTIYCGRTNLFKSTNQGTSWAAVTSAVPGTGTIVDFKVAPSNNQVIYVVKSNAVYKTTNGGGAWTTVTGTLPVGSAAITRVDVKPSDPNTAIVTFSGYSAGNKAFKTTNGGTSWTNISTGLPNLPCNCVRFDASSSIDGVYVGCDVGLYYMDNTFTSWQPYFTGLPNVPVDDIEVYTPTGKLRAATYGRGVWETDVYNPGTLPPIAAFTPNTFITCVGSPVNFTDQSSFTPTSWSWTFPSGTPATSTVQNPTGITWSTPGTYTVSLTCSNANGTSSPATQVITVLGSVAPPLVEGFQATQFVPAGWTANNINNDAIYWTRANVGAASTNSAMFDNYNLDVAGARDEMWAPRLNCSAFSTLTMTFDVAYARYDATYSDSLQVVVSTDCGATWNSVYLKGGGPVSGSNLATAPDQTASIFTPTSAQWRNETVNLNAYAGQSSVLVVFRNRGHYGQALYVDNINITGTAAAVPSANFTASATTVCAGTPVNFTDASSGSPTSWSWTFPSGTPASATTQNVTGVVWNTAGTYTVTHTATNGSGTGTTTQVITVNALPSVTTTTTAGTICSGNSTTITASGATTYSWMPGSLTGTTITVSPASTTTYTVTGTGANGCTNTATRTITVNPTPTVTVSAAPSTICSGSSSTMTASGATTYSWMPGSLSGTSVTVTPASTITYTVTGTSSGCTGTATQAITVNPSPTVTTTTTGGTICSGNSTTITASGATTYSWMPGSLTGTTVTVSPASTTTYTVTGTSGSCTGTATRTITVNPSPTVTVTATSTSICTGNSTTLTAAGASTYNWMPGSLTGTSVTVTPAASTTYTVTGTGANGCTGTTTQFITVTPSPTVTVTTTGGTICSGSSTTITASGATTYSWMPGSLTGTTVTVSPATTTTYTVTGTSGACTGTATQLITVNPSPTVTTTTTAGTICSGNSTTITASGATSYSWMPGSLTGTSVTVTPAASTTYTVTGTGANGCTGTATRTITVNPTPTVTATASSSSICSGNSVTLTATGATTYNWMPGSLTGASVTTTPASTTTYTVTGTSTGCTGTATVTVTVGAPPTVTVSASSTSICNGSNTTLTAAGAATYTWMPGSLSGTSVTVAPTASTTYTVTGSTGPGCSNTATVAITVNPVPTVSTTTTGGTICSGNSTTITASGATTYSWMPGSLTGTTVTVSPTSTTTYTVTGTTAAGCSNTATRIITVNPSPTVTATASSPTICSGNTVTLSASGANTYNWQPGNHNGQPWTTSPASTTTYTVTGTTTGCTGTATVTVTVGPPPTVTASAASSSICTGSNTTLTGSGATTYSWMPGSLSGTTVTVTPASTTTYTVTGSNGPGCTGTATVAVTVNPLPTVSTTTTAATICNGDSTTITASGAATYSWMPGSLTGTTVTVTPTTTTTYTVTGTSAAGCTNTTTRTITVNPAPILSVTPLTATICPGGTVNLDASPVGTATFSWSPATGLTAPNAANTDASPLTTTTYVVTKTTTAGCSISQSVTITVNPTPTVTATASNTSVCTGSSVTLTASGATTYNWMPGNLSGATVTDVPSITTTYTVTGTDPSGCNGTATVAVTVNPNPTVSATIDNGTVCAGTSVTLTGSGASTYDWQPINITGNPVTDVPSVSVNYTVTGTDINGCTGTGIVSVTVNPLPVVTATASSNAVCTGTTINVTATGANTYSWQPTSQSGATISDTPVSSTTYTVTGTDINGCTATDTAAVVVYTQPTITITGNDSICLGSSTTLTASGGVNYFWPLGGQSTTVITDSPTATTTYTVNGTDASGCSNTATFVVTVGTPPATPSIIVNGSVLTSSVSGASYQWFLNGVPINGATSQSYTATQMGSYTVEVYDVVGCGSGQSAAVLDPTGIAVATNVDAITVIPNPNDGHFVLNFHINKTDNYVLEIHDALGQVVYSESLLNFKGAYNKEIDLSIYGRGVYTIRLRGSSSETTIKSLTY